MSVQRVKMRGVGFRGAGFRGAGLAVAAGAIVLLAACGSSGSTATAGGQPSASNSTSAPTTVAATAADVMTASNAKLGTVLVGSTGNTVYTLTDASGKAVACTGQCLTFWPPLLLASGSTTATGATGVTGLATVAAGGGTQVTENGLPLYYFSGDKAVGTANGEGIASFGGTWHAVKSSAAPSGGAPAPTAATVPAAGDTTTTGGYGY